MDTMKLVIGWSCNLDCSYCCNKQRHVQDSFKPITQEELTKTDYRDYELTGGEILLPEYWSIAGELCRNWIPKGKNIYFYSNGLWLSNIAYGRMMSNWGVKGLNIGYHGVKLDWKALQRINDFFVPIRIWVKEDEIEQIPKWLGLPIRAWKLGECDEIRTDRFYLKAK